MIIKNKYTTAGIIAAVMIVVSLQTSYDTSDSYSAYQETWDASVTTLNDPEYQTHVIKKRQGGLDSAFGLRQGTLQEKLALIMAALPGIFALLGVISVAINMEKEIDSLKTRMTIIETRMTTTETEQTSICKAAKAVGATSLTALTDAEVTASGESSAPTGASVAGTQIQLLITTINGFGTPRCN